MATLFVYQCSLFPLEIVTSSCADYSLPLLPIDYANFDRYYKPLDLFVYFLELSYYRTCIVRILCWSKTSYENYFRAFVC